MKRPTIALLTLGVLVGAVACGGGGRSASQSVLDPPTLDIEAPPPPTDDPGNGQEKLTICHKAEDGSKAHTIEVAEPALEHHLAHGDTQGECLAEPLPATESDRTTLCHIPPGNAAKAHTIVVGNAAVDHHVGHGDTLGACAE